MRKMRFLLVLGRKTLKLSSVTRLINFKSPISCFWSRPSTPCVLSNPKRTTERFRSNNIYFTSYVSNFETEGTAAGGVQYLQDLRDNPRLTAKQRLASLDELWTKLENSLALQEEHFILKLECFMKCQVKVVPKSFLKQVTDAGLEKSERLLRVLLTAVAEHGDPGYVSSVITSMKSRNYIVDETVFSGLISAYGVTRDSANIRFVLNSMQECGVPPGKMTFTSLMRAAGIAGDYTALHTARTQAEESGVTFSSENILSVLETLARYSRHHLISSVKPLASCCTIEQLNNLATGLVYSGFASGAYSVLKLADDGDLTARCKDFVQEMLHVNTPLNQLIDVAGAMREDGAYDRAYYDVMHRKMCDSKIEDAVTVITTCHESGQSVRAHFFYPLMMAAHRQNGEKGIWDILILMKSLKIQPDSETFTDFVLPRLTLDEHDAVLKRLQEASGVTLSALIVPFLSNLLKSGNLSQVVTLYQRYEKSVPRNEMSTLMTYLEMGYAMTRDYKTVTQLIRIFKIDNVGNWLMMLFSQRKWLPLTEYTLLFKELAALDCWITPQEEKWLLQIFLRNNSLSEEIKTALGDLVNEEGEPTAPVFIPHPSEMNASELKNHVIELENKGGNTRGALRKLLQQCCRSRDIQGAQTAYEKLEKMGADLSPGILSSLFHVHVQAGLLENALQILKSIGDRYPQFRVDSFKILDLATLLVKSGKYPDAVQVINLNPQHRKNVDSIERNCWELLSATVETENSLENVKQMIKILLVNNYCKVSNVILGPLMKTLIKGGDLEALVTEFCACAHNHKITPLQLDVMLAVVSGTDDALISQTMYAIACIHGVDSARAVLITSLVLTGNSERLKKEIQETNMNLKNGKLRSQIERMSALGQVEGLLVLFNAFHNNRDESLDYLIDRLFHTYQRIGDTDGALKFWNDLLSKGVELSEKQKSSLAGLVASTSKSQN